MRRSAQVAVSVTVAVVAAAAAFALGRTTAPSAPEPASTTTAYLDGLRAGEAQGRMEGRADQEGVALPAGDRSAVHDAFTAGYVAGLNDAFAGYDGGWSVHVPWIVTLEPGSGKVVYRIADRRAVQPGVDYYLCPDGHTICQRPR